jgi:hypothetical protein
MTQANTRLVKNPQISARYLADYMCASEVARRGIVQRCRYRAIARVIQHDEAKVAIGRYFQARDPDIEALRHAAARLRERLADDAFDRDLYDHNADYIDRFADIADQVAFPGSEVHAPGPTPALLLGGTKVSVEFCFRLLRVTRTNKIKVGAVSLRYAKRKALDVKVAEWQSAFTIGYLSQAAVDGAEPEAKLCITLDAYTGECHAAPGDARRRFSNMEAACAAIAERWDKIPPPKDAVL